MHSAQPMAPSFMYFQDFGRHLGVAHLAIVLDINTAGPALQKGAGWGRGGGAILSGGPVFGVPCWAVVLTWPNTHPHVDRKHSLCA